MNKKFFFLPVTLLIIAIIPHAYAEYEDTIVITEEGMENFTDFLPSELNELEDLVKEKGILQTLTPDSMRWNY